MTLEEAIELFKLPRSLGDYEDKEVKIGVGRYGPYVHHNSKYASLLKIRPTRSYSRRGHRGYLAKREADAKKHIKSFDEEPDMQVLNGRYGPYIAYKRKTTVYQKIKHLKIYL